MTDQMQASDSAAHAITLRGVVREFGAPGSKRVRAVDGVDLTIAPGEVVALLGPNGAGKTTALDMVLGLSSPTEGSVEVFGASPRAAISAGRVSAVLQSGGLLADLTVAETVRLIASTYRRPAGVDDVLARAGLTDLGGRRVSKCSGGEQQRLRFALSLLPEPDLLILDEPTAAMDVNARHAFWDAMHAEARGGRTVVFATHYLEEADQFADRIVLMARGRIVADGPTDEIRAHTGGRTVSADLDTTADTGALLSELGSLDGVRDLALSGSRVKLQVGAEQSDAVALHLLRSPHASQIEVVAASLESAFMQITGDDAPADLADPTSPADSDEVTR